VPTVAVAVPRSREPAPPPAAPRIGATTQAVKPPTAVATSYWVQVAAFRNLEAAMRLAAALQAQREVVADRWAVMMEPGPGGQPLVRVRVGPFADRTAAAANVRDLEALGYRPFIAEDRRSPR
jgi:cell division septation protein DedD